MASTMNGNVEVFEKKYEDLIYIRQVLGELRVMADRHRAQMLCYLLDMAYQETSDLVQEEHKKSVQYS
jgi:hypothetical protein